MDGLEMCRQIREYGPLSTIPIVLLTAKGDKETEKRSISLGIDSFIPKPFELPNLTARIDQLIGNKQRMEQKLRMEYLSAPQDNAPLSYDEKYLKKVTQVIEEHMDDSDLSVARLCELGDFSEKLLYRKLKQLTGLSTVEYIRSVRLKKAALLLQNGNFTVSEAMYSVGFSNASYFTRAFAAQYGKTPSEYLKQYKKHD
jgi:AraC-like DNA-binding protein